MGQEHYGPRCDERCVIGYTDTDPDTDTQTQTQTQTQTHTHTHTQTRHRHTPLGSLLLGRLPIVQWCRSQGAEFTTWTAEQAAANGHLHVLKW